MLKFLMIEITMELRMRVTLALMTLILHVQNHHQHMLVTQMFSHVQNHLYQSRYPGGTPPETPAGPGLQSPEINFCIPNAEACNKTDVLINETGDLICDPKAAMIVLRTFNLLLLRASRVRQRLKLTIAILMRKSVIQQTYW